MSSFVDRLNSTRLLLESSGLPGSVNEVIANFFCDYKGSVESCMNVFEGEINNPLYSINDISIKYFSSAGSYTDLIEVVNPYAREEFAFLESHVFRDVLQLLSSGHKVSNVITIPFSCDMRSDFDEEHECWV